MTLWGCGRQAAQGCAPPQAKTGAAPTVAFGQGNTSPQTIAATAKIAAAFSEPMKAETLTTATLVFVTCQGPQGSPCSATSAVAGAVTYDDCTATVTFTPESLLSPGTTFEAAVAACPGNASDPTCLHDSLPRDGEGLPIATGTGGGTCPSTMPNCVASFPITTGSA